MAKIFVNADHTEKRLAENAEQEAYFKGLGLTEFKTLEDKVNELTGETVSLADHEALKAENVKLIEENIALKAQLELVGEEPEKAEKPKKKKASKK